MLIDDLFQGRLLPGERIVWSGSPGQGLVLTSRDLFLVPFSFMWCAFAVFWTFSASDAGAPIFFRLWGVMFIGVGLYFVFGRFLVDSWIRRSTRYALTGRRILIARPPPFGSLKSIDLQQLPQAELSERRDGRGTIRFGPSTPMWGTRGMSAWSPSLDNTPQFIAINEARRVFDLVQRSAAK